MSCGLCATSTGSRYRWVMYDKFHAFFIEILQLFKTLLKLLLLKSHVSDP